jgi:flagellar biosynthesis protein FlhG
MSRLITVTSGKGGVGKTNISANIALYIASQGYRVCLFDADLGLANINILLGLYPEYDLGDVILNGKKIDDILIKNYKGIDIIPGSSGIEKIANLEPDKLDHFVRSFSELNSRYDFFILDTAAGVSKNVISFCMISSEVILIVTPEPTSLTDAYALLKILSLNGYKHSVMVTVNHSKNIQNAKMVFTKFKETVQKFLPIKVVPLGAVMQDTNVVKAVKEQKPFIYLYPNTIASSCIKSIAKHLVNKKAEDVETFCLDTFWTKFLNVFKGPLKSTSPKVVNKQDKLEDQRPEKERELTSAVATDEKTQPAKIVEKPPNSSQLAQPQLQSQPNDKPDLTHEIHFLMEGLVKHMSSISQDIGAIRKFIEHGRIEPPKTQEAQAGVENSEATIIPLDFEAFLERRKTG